MTIQTDAQVLAEARKKHETLARVLTEERQAWESHFSALIAATAEAQIAIRTAEEKLRSAGLAYYAENPDTKKLPFGLGVRFMTSLEYDPVAAFVWALEHKLALTLDKKAFESIAKTHNVPFVTMKETVTVTLPTDIAKLLTK